MKYFKSHLLLMFFLIIQTKVLAQVTFTAITSNSIVSSNNDDISVSWADYDQDGDLDLIVGNSGGTNFFYRRSTGLAFSTNDATYLDLSTDESAFSYSSCWVDYNNDGFLDVFFSNASSNQLFVNNQDGTLSKVTGTTISDLTASPKRNSLWLDFDNDGDLDVFFLLRFADAALYLNDGDNVNYSSQDISIFGQTEGGNWGDYDQDGDMDLFIANNQPGQNNFLFENNGSSLTAVTSGNPIVASTNASKTGLWGDYDNDEDLDLFVISTSNTVDNEYYRNDGNGNFTAITTGNIVTAQAASKAASHADLDNDGDLDICIVNDNEANQLFFNNGDGTFTENTGTTFSDNNRQSEGIALGDVNEDGFVDIYIANFSANNEFFTNNRNANHWIGLNLKGTKSNKFGIGAKVRLTAGGLTQYRELQPNNGYGGQNDYRINFGIGSNTSITSISIQWPSGASQEITNPSIDQYLDITELVPNITLSNMASPANIAIGSENQILLEFEANVTNSSASLDELQLQGSGTFSASDFNSNGLKLWYHTNNDFSTATLLAQTDMPNSKLLNFTALNLDLNVGQTYYLWLTGDISTAATNGHTIKMALNNSEVGNGADITNNLVESEKTFILEELMLASPLLVGVATAEGSVQANEQNIPLYQIQIQAPTERQDFTLESLNFTTEGTYTESDFETNSLQLLTNTTDDFSAASLLASQDIIASGESINFNSLNKMITANTNLFLWLTINTSDNPTNENNLKISTPSQSDFVLNNINSIDMSSSFEEPNLITINNPALANLDVIYPNIFTPNGDGQNDSFILRLANVSSINLTIWDRFGNTVYQTNDVGEATQIGWNGDNHPTGLYIWNAKITLEGNTQIAKKGEVKLVR